MPTIVMLIIIFAVVFIVGIVGFIASYAHKKEKLVVLNAKLHVLHKKRFDRVLDMLGIETKGTLWGRSFDLVTLRFKDDSPIEKLEKKINLIIDHLGLEYKSTEERTAGIEGKLYKKPSKGEKKK